MTKHKYTTSAMRAHNLKQHHARLFVIELIGWSLVAALALIIAVLILT